MGWKSTISLTREQMEQSVRLELAKREDLSGLSDEELSDLLELLMGGDEHGNNYRVVPPGLEDK
jgi:hypothetical protein